MKENSKYRLLEVMSRLDKTFKPTLNENQENNTFTLNLWGEDNELYLKLGKYNNGALNVNIMSPTEGPFTTLSTNLPESDNLPKDEFFMKSWGENEEIATSLIEKGIVIPTGNEVSTGFVVVKSYKLNPEYIGGMNENMPPAHSDIINNVENYISNHPESDKITVLNMIISNIKSGRQLTGSQWSLIKSLDSTSSEQTDEGYRPYKSYSNDPKWITAKYDGVSKNGEKFSRGDKVLYYPSSKEIYTGDEARSNWNDFESSASDEYQTSDERRYNGIAETTENINPKYTHFAISKDTGLIMSAWNYSEYTTEELRNNKNDYFVVDLKDMGINPKTINILTTDTMKKRGINPFNANSWMK